MLIIILNESQKGIKMEEKIIKYSNRKRLFLIVYGLIICIASGIMLYLILTAERVKVTYALCFAMLNIIGIVLIAFQIRKVFGSDKVGLKMDSEGFVFSGTTLGRQVGRLSWQDISSINSSKVYGSKQLFLKLRSPDDLLKKLSGNQGSQVLLQYGLPINASELEIGFSDLETLMMQYFHRYHQKSI